MRAQTMGREQGCIAALWAVAGGEARQSAHGVGRRCSQSTAGWCFGGGFGQRVGRGVDRSAEERITHSHWEVAMQ